MNRTIVWEGDTELGYYQVVDTMYDDRPARVLYSGDAQAAQSGIAKDGRSDLLFDYNQRLLELATALNPQDMLIIGGGAGTLATAVLAHLPFVRVDVVEPDGGLTKLAYSYFDLPVDIRLRIFHTDGLEYLNDTAKRYDVIVLDAFNHTTIPAELMTSQAFHAFHTALTIRGVFCANIISAYHGPNAVVLQNMCQAASSEFSNVDLFLASAGYSLWLPQNFVLTAHKHPRESLQSVTRGISIELP